MKRLTTPPLHLLAALIAAIGAVASIGHAVDTAGRPPNFVIIFADDMPPEHIGAYGGTHKTPAIDRLAAEGTRFDEAFCVSSMCTPSRFSLLTGKYPGHCRAPSFLRNNPEDEPYNISWNTELTADEHCMGEIFSRIGYQTGYVGKWHLAPWPSLPGLPQLPEDADVTDPRILDLLEKRQAMLAAHLSRITGFEVVNSLLWANYDELPVKALRAHNFEWLTNGALDFLDQVDPDRPFLLYFASTAVHGPSHDRSILADPTVSPGGRVELRHDAYPPRSQIIEEVKAHTGGKLTHIDTGLLCLDYQVAAIRRKLTERGLDRNTLILYLSDHGIEPGKATSYLRGTRIPFIATWLGHPRPAPATNIIVQIPDILPTLWDLATGNAPAPVDDWDGISFAEFLRTGRGAGRRFAYFENGFTRSVYRDGLHYIAWRYPRSVIEKMRSGELQEAPDHLNTMDNGQASITIERLPAYWDPDQLYVLAEDPYELTNRFDDPRFSDAITSLQADLRAVLDTFRHPFDLEGDAFQRSAAFDKLKQPRIKRGTGYIHWYRPGMHPWPPADAARAPR